MITYRVSGSGEGGPVARSVVEGVDCGLPPVLDDEAGDVGAGGGGEDGGKFHLF